MYQTRKALIDHLKNSDLQSPALTIAKYAGEIGDKGRSPNIRIDLPAILILFLDGFPLKEVQDHTFSLLFITDTQTADNEESEKDGLLMVSRYAEWMFENYRFEDDNNYYQIVDLENAKANTLLNDHKYTIIELPVRVKLS